LTSLDLHSYARHIRHYHTYCYFHYLYISSSRNMIGLWRDRDQVYGFVKENLMTTLIIFCHTCHSSPTSLNPSNFVLRSFNAENGMILLFDRNSGYTCHNKTVPSPSKPLIVRTYSLKSLSTHAYSNFFGLQSKPLFTSLPRNLLMFAS